jgi:hypothetical protein
MKIRVYLTGPFCNQRLPLWDHPYWTALGPSVSDVGPSLLDRFGTIGFRCGTFLIGPFWDHPFLIVGPSILDLMYTFSDLCRVPSVATFLMQTVVPHMIPF